MNFIANHILLPAAQVGCFWIELILGCNDLFSYSFLSLKEVALGSYLIKDFQFQI